MSQPKTITRPDAPLYSTQVLELFQEYTYETWKGANGGQEPPFDPTLPPQYHADDRFIGLPADTPVSYLILDTYNRKLVTYNTTAGRASKVNIPNPTGMPSTKINIPAPWTERAAADACAAVIGGTVIDNAPNWQGMIPPSVHYSVTAPGMRRPEYVITMASHLTNDTASSLQAYFKEIGVGVDVITAEQAAAKAYATDAALPRVPMPMAALLPTESIVNGTVPGTVLVKRGDVAPAVNNQGGGGLTVEEHDALMAIKAAVVKG